MAALVRFLLSNFTLTFFVLGLLAAAVGHARLPRPRARGALVEELLAWFLFFSIGVSFLYNFVMHVFFGEIAARFIGWADSPFQAEVGYRASASRRSAFSPSAPARRRLAAILGPALFLWGAAVGHALDMIRRTTSRRATPG